MFLKICFILNIIQIYTLFKQQAEFQYFLERVPVPVPLHQSILYIVSTLCDVWSVEQVKEQCLEFGIKSMSF